MKLAQAIIDNGLLGDIGRNALGVGDALLSVGSSIVAQPLAGLAALRTMGKGGSFDDAANTVERVSDQLQYQPRTQEGQERLQDLGGLLILAGRYVANTDAGHAVNEKLYDLSASNPALMALAVGGLNVLGGPEAAAERGAARSLLNVGLKVGDRVALSEKQVLKALKKRGANVVRSQVRDSATEPTVIATLQRAMSPEDAHALAVELGQDAIAQKSGGVGLLHGPKADEWGPFNDEYFLQHEAPFPQYAEQYPPLAPAATKFDKERNREFIGRGTSPETRDFLAEKLKIQREIDEYGIEEPYFNVDERYDVDPSQYADSGESTLTHGLPKKQATVDKWRKEIQTDEARARLQAAFDNGRALGGNEHWYKMGQLEKEFIDELGPEEGRRAFKERFADAMAATTAGNSPEMNLIAAGYGNYQRSRGLPAATRTFEQPVPVIDLKSNMKSYNRAINEGAGISLEDNPKRFNFSGNFLGRRGSSTIDEQMHSIITGKKGAPTGDSYFAFEELVKEMAEKNGVDPRYFQEVAWGGHKGVHGKPMIQIVNEAIERTHRLTGMPKREIVRRGLVRGELPIYATAGAGLLAPFLTNHDTESM